MSYHFRNNCLTDSFERTLELQAAELEVASKVQFMTGVCQEVRASTKLTDIKTSRETFKFLRRQANFREKGG